ncbi:hypothetical protein QTP86_027229, partial [Hemibagrus guttatus]
MPEPLQLPPFDVEKQRLYSELLPGDRAPYPISKGAPRHPTEEAHFGRLYLGSYPFGHDPELLTIAENIGIPQLLLRSQYIITDDCSSAETYSQQAELLVIPGDPSPVMASSSSVLCEDQLQCPICLDVFTDPVSTPCGHNFCMLCLKEFWNRSSHCQCPLCKEEFHKHPELRVNMFTAALAAPFIKSVQVTSSTTADKLPLKTKKVLCDSCTEEKLEALKSCLDCGVSYCNTHLMLHKTTANLMKHKLIDPVENLENYICLKHERPLESFCRDDQIQLGKTQAKVQQMIQERLKKTEKIKHSVKLNEKTTEKEKADVVKIFSNLMRCIERNQAELLNVMEEKQKAAERQAEEFIKELEQEITELTRRNTELGQLSHTEDHLHLLQIYPSLCSPLHTQDWTRITIKFHLSVETLSRSVSQLQEILREEMDKLDQNG